MVLLVFLAMMATFPAWQAGAIISLFNDCYGPNVVVSMLHPSSADVLYQGTPPIGSLLQVNTTDAQIVECTFSIPVDLLGVTTVLEDGSHVLLQDYLVLKGRKRPMRIGVIGYLTDPKGTITSTLFQL